MWGRILILCLFAALSFIASPQTGIASDNIVSKININITDTEDKTPWREMAEKFLYIEEGESFSQDKWDLSLRAIKKSSQFEKVETDLIDSDSGKIITLTLKPGKWIEDIRVKGYYPMFEREVFNSMGVYVGDPYDVNIGHAQKDLLEQLFKNEGFISPRVEINVEKTPENNSVILNIDITKGKYYFLNALTFTGNLRTSESALRLKMKSWRNTYLIGVYDRFREKELKADITKLRDYYRSQGYAEAVVTSSVETNHETGAVNLTIDVKTGPRYEIFFNGNDSISSRKLKDEIVVLNIGNRFDYGIRKSLQRVRARYQEEGFAFASIATKEFQPEMPEENTRYIMFEITEGPKVRITSISFSGNTILSDDTLLSYLQSKADGGLLTDDAFDVQKLDDDQRIITALYLKEGFLDIASDYKVSYSESKEEADVLFEISEGVQAKVGTITFEGNTIIDSTTCMNVIEMKPDTIYLGAVISSDLKKLKRLFSEKGYPYARVAKEIEINETNSEINVSYKINEGKYVQVGQIIYNGNFKTKQRIIKRELGIKEGDPFVLSKVMAGQRELQSISALSTVQVKQVGLEDGADIIHLVVDIEERKPYSLNLGGGYESEKGFFVEAGGSNKNLLGLNKTFNAKAEYSEIGYLAEMGIIEPHFLKTKTLASLSVFGEEIQEFNQNFGTRSYGVSSGLSRKWKGFITSGLGLKYENRETFVDDLEQMLAENPDYNDDEGGRSILTATPYLTFDRRNSPLRPQNGYYTNALIDLSKGVDNSLDDFIKYGLDLRYYIPTTRYLTFALTAQNYLIETYGGGVLPPDQLLYLGGNSTVRGFGF